jgi:hypothetical protein
MDPNFPYRNGGSLYHLASLHFIEDRNLALTFVEDRNTAERQPWLTSNFFPLEFASFGNDLLASLAL